jgi:hypothetical protein
LSAYRAAAPRGFAQQLERYMKLTLIALGASAGCLLLAGSAMAGPCAAQIEMLSKQLNSTDAGMGPTGGADTMDQTAANPVSPSGSMQTPTTPATGTMNQASQNKATSPQDVQNQNTGQGTMTDQADAGLNPGNSNSDAAAALARARQLDDAGDAGCMTEVNKAQDALKTQP